MSLFFVPTRFSIVVLLVACGYNVLLSNAALAGPAVIESFNTTHPVVSFVDCNTKAQQALHAMALTVTGKTDNQNNEDMWFGRSEKTTATILCYPSGGGRSVQVFVTAANEGSGVDAGVFHRQLLANFYGPAAPGSQSTP